jgi:hypothetical protein
MADNLEITAGAGTTMAADEIGGVKYPRAKLTWGPDGTANDTDVASGKPMPIQVRSSTGTEVTFNANGRATAANSAPVTLPSDAATSASATFTPAAASHVAGDVNGGAQEFTSMGLSAGRIMITSASLEIDGGTAEATAWRLYLFNVTPPSAIADDGAFALPSGDRASYLGQIDIGTAVDLGDTQWVETHGINKQIKLSGTSVFAYLVNLTTLTPANVAHIVTLHAVQL